MMSRHKNISDMEALDFEVLIARALSCDDHAAARALAELAARHGLKLNSTWIKRRAIEQKGLWRLRQEGSA
jgi:hypothetical protein